MRAKGSRVFLFAALGTCLAAVSLMARGNGFLIMLDEELNSALAPFRTPRSLVRATWISTIANPGTAAVLTTVSMVWLWKAGRRSATLSLALLAILVPLSFESLKIIVDRPRPEPLAGIVETGLSFPSGTTTIASAIFSCLAYLLSRESDSALLHRALASLVALLVALVGYSRMILSVHYFSDVVAGAILGLLCMLASVAIAERFGPSRS